MESSPSGTSGSVSGLRVCSWRLRSYGPFLFRPLLISFYYFPRPTRSSHVLKAVHECLNNCFLNIQGTERFQPVIIIRAKVRELTHLHQKLMTYITGSKACRSQERIFAYNLSGNTDVVISRREPFVLKHCRRYGSKKCCWCIS